MIDELFDLVFHAVFEFLPDAVLRIILLLLGVVTTMIGVMTVGESTRLGGILIAVGVLLVAGALALWCR
ncbi:hypothetical protein C461_00432 [Halorubrum aidingense JCM 13560]|uniref:Uncharacterized protein n=1 Tax=Halorubrum aidingense JCM 13560 TaxID=1230454 RepID=M0PM31_9EURY|nr:hypothetical protein [Halorubrum aidingense]EMA70709.1 hypothetical protein C461_00432 [Halorubrum aidingense JCM 13560]